MNQLDTQALGKLAELDAALPGCMLADRLRLGRRIVVSRSALEKFLSGELRADLE